MEHLVVDTGAIIRGQGYGFHKVAKRFWTVAEVLDEIRDVKSRDLLLSLPFELEIKSPSDQSMRAVAAFARKTGDFASLSLTDLKLIALTYTLEMESTGGAHIRLEPKSLQLRDVNNASKKSENISDKAKQVVSSLESMSLASMPAEVSHVSSFNDNGTCGCEEYEESESNERSIVEEEGTKSDIPEPPVVESAVETTVVDNIMPPTPPVVTAVPEPIVVPATAPAPAPRVTFAPETENDKVPIWEDSDAEFPSLGGPAAAVSEAIAPAAKSWANLTSSNRPDASSLPKHMPKKAVEQVIPASVSSSSAAAANVSFFSGAGTAPVVDTDGSIAPVKETVPTREANSRFIVSAASSSLSSTITAERAAEEDDGLGWVNPTNIASCRLTGDGMMMNMSKSQNSLSKQKRYDAGSGVSMAASPPTVSQTGDFIKPKKTAKSKIPVSPTVGCVTCDFSMQNVIIQMALHVVSPADGMLIRRVNQWVLRCGACLKVHYNMEKQFCSKCGAHQMQRISASVDSNTGELKLHLKKNYQYSTRGQKYSMPKPGQQGRYEGELLLREDQLLSGIWKQKMVKIKKDVKSAFGADVVSDVGLHINKAPPVKYGLGRRNINADKGRERRGSKKH